MKKCLTKRRKRSTTSGSSRTGTGQLLPDRQDKTITASEDEDKDRTITARTYRQRTTTGKETVNGINALGVSVGEAAQQTLLARSLLMAEVTASPSAL
jgi:hypothetical protein